MIDGKWCRDMRGSGLANESMRMSATGMTTLRQRERTVLRFYNDPVNNCTSGVGILAHLGPCTEAELQRPVTVAEANRQLSLAVADAEFAVRRHVTRTQLTQDQFDALVSFTFNAGASGARPTLDAADRGANDEVARRMSDNVFARPRDVHGRRLAPVRLPGLVIRRQGEAAPFRLPSASGAGR
jgi:lysozyme